MSFVTIGNCDRYRPVAPETGYYTTLAIIRLLSNITTFYNAQVRIEWIINSYEIIKEMYINYHSIGTNIK